MNKKMKKPFAEMGLPDESNVKTISLERIYYKYRALVGSYAFNQLTVEMRDDVLAATVVEACGEVLSSIIEDKTAITPTVDFEKWFFVPIEVVTDSPLNWWEHFKLQCFPKWLQSKFPVKYKERRHKFQKTALLKGTKSLPLKVRAKFPQANIQTYRELGLGEPCVEVGLLRKELEPITYSVEVCDKA